MKNLLSDDEVEQLHKRVRSQDKRRARHGQGPLTREEIHQLAVEANRDEIVNNVRLRAARLDPSKKRKSVHDRLGELQPRGLAPEKGAKATPRIRRARKVPRAASRWKRESLIAVGKGDT